MVFYWWYSFSRVGREEWALASYLLMLPFPVFVYLQCVVLYPNRLDEVTDLGAYFMATRRWFFGLMLLVTLADFAEGGLIGGTDPAAAAYLDSTGWSLMLVVAFTIFAALAGIASSNARIHIGLAGVLIMLGIWQQFDDHPVLGALSF